MFDLLIYGGTTIDGTGDAAYKGSVAVTGNQLQILTGHTSAIEAARYIDATDRVVCPGFIDVHTHSDLMALADPKNEPKIRQGVTTEIVGVDGIGYAPLSKRNLDMMLMLYSGLNGYPELEYNWSSVAEYLKCFRRRTCGNIAYMIPNSCLRAETVGWDKRSATKAEIAAMKKLTEQAMDEGAIGMSTGLSYAPGSYADTDELVEICDTVAKCGGVYVTHVRPGSPDDPFGGFAEAVEIGRRSGCPVHISHYRGPRQIQGQADKSLKFIDDAIASGSDLSFDMYPWVAGSTTLTTYVPQWAHDGGPYRLIERLRNKGDRNRMRDDVTPRLSQIEQVVICAVRTEKNKWCEGLTIKQVASKLGKESWDAVCDLLEYEELEVGFTVFGGDMTDVNHIITHSAHMFSSDGLRTGSMPNPRTYGTFAKVLGQISGDEKIMSLETAVSKMTAIPARRFGFIDRGILKDGMKADIVVFNPNTVKCTATFENPRQFPKGIEYVIVNGKTVVDKGTHTGVLAGEPLNMKQR
ncbi:amidohydrolase family protein [Chloroflexota bacterium]